MDGWATYYADGVMARVAVNRGYIHQVDEFPAFLEGRGYVGAVALNRMGDLGRSIWLERDPGEVEGPFLSLDCAALEDYGRRVKRLRIVEVDWTTSRRWGMRGPVPVRVWFVDPGAE